VFEFLEKSMENVAVILAGGSGARFGGKIPKQFVKIGGTPLIKLTVSKFAKRDDISKIIVVIIEEWLSETKEILAEYENIYIILGG
jgi:2-C-methyl-D-erythritol 4-phosphate cytidylyltransferase